MRRNTIHSVHSAPSRQDQWNEDDLIARLAKTLDQAEDAIRMLGSADAAATETPGTHELVAEVAVLLLAASSVGDYAAIGPRIVRVATLLLPHAHSVRTLHRICLEPAAAFEHATAHICLKRLGFYDCDFDAVLDLAAASQAADGRGRTPHQMLEQEWLKQGWLYPEGMRRLRCGAHIASSPLNRPIDLLYGSREDVHGFTHAVMHMSDFTLFPRSFPRCREALLDEAEGLLARCLDREEYELAAEVLMAWPLTGEEWSPVAAFGFRVVARVEETRGLRGRAEPSSPGRFNIGLLCAASLADRRMPPVKIAPTPVRTGAFNAVLDLIDLTSASAARKPWQEELDEAEPCERESLTRFLLSVAIHRECGRQDFTALRRVLEVGAALRIADTAVASQAAEMVGRLVQFTESLAYAEVEQVEEISICA